jgi:dipeptidyl aminopeptidase/acylaminoacyl peptidase
VTDAVRVRSGKTTTAVDFVIRPLAAPALPSHLDFGEPVRISHDYPVPTMAQRTRVAFDRAGQVVVYVYEPRSGSAEKQELPLGSMSAGALPGLLAAYPGDPLDWEAASMAFVAQGYVVLATGPVSMRGMDITPDTNDVIVAATLFHQGDLSPVVDSARIVALGGSFSSLALMRALHYTPYIRGVVLMGGLTDVYRLRHDVYLTSYTGHTVYPHLERAMWGLGRPDRMPRLYIENSAVFDVQGLPPLCIIHGTGDKVIPHHQSERLAAALHAEGRPYELHIYRETGHYPGIHDPDPDTEAMYRQMVRFFAERLDASLTTKKGEPLAHPLQ